MDRHRAYYYWGYCREHFVNNNHDVKVVEIVHSNGNVFLYYMGDVKEDKITPWRF